MMAVMARQVVFSQLLAAGLAAVDTDTGYNLLFENAVEEFSDHCVELSSGSKPFPAWATGDFVMPSVGLTSFKGRDFVGLLDGYGKMQRFEMKESKVCATYRIMATSWFNKSQKDGRIAPELLFFDTVPPMPPCPITDPMCRVSQNGANDNCFVNTVQLGQTMLSVTDSHTMLEIDPKSMAVLQRHSYADKLEGLAIGGSAHPMNHPVTGDWIDFVTNANVLDGHATMRFFTLNQSDPSHRNFMADVHFTGAPYVHSFGVTNKYVVVPRMPVRLDVMDVLMHPLHEAFKDMTRDEDNCFVVVPLDGSQSSRRLLPEDEKLYYVHMVNTFENDSHITIDLTTSSENPFAGNTLALPSIKDKASRDAFGRNLVKRFVMPIDGDRVSSVTVISDANTSIDFTKINSKRTGLPYCFFWGVQWFHDHKAYASMAIVKRDLCSGAPDKTWHREHWYPSEPTMIPDPRPDADEDEGLLLFTGLDGSGNTTSLITVDARTMEVVSEAGPLPRIGFTTHGQFYPAGTWGETSQQAASETLVI